jgi:mannose-6-phosphate isomerase-like protein (cupin superfamily)|tara:strand:- start:499 stop:1281 length:783 start_codon:yes stop_codon:yes gene_type:complete
LKDQIVKRIIASERDKISLKRLRCFRDISENNQPDDYKNKVVLKPWGHEYLIFENEHAAAWFLHIKYGHSTSMHCHPQKKTSLILLSGNAICNTFEQRNYLESIDSIILEKAVFHSTKALSPDGIDVIEIETPPDKTDLVRLNDEYGRASYGYEGMSEMHTEDLDKFKYFYFETSDMCNCKAYASSDYSVSLEVVPEKSRLDICEIQGDALYSIFKGQVFNSAGIPVLDVGDTEYGHALKSKDALGVSDKTIFLKVAIGI